MHVLVRAVLGLASVSALLAAPPSAGAAFPGANGKIAFSSTPDRFGAPSEIYSMNPDGTGQTTLATGFFPAWSPDGQRIAFADSAGINVMNADGTGQMTLAFGNQPAWSPDGRKIAFVASDGDLEIYTMNADGTAQTKLTDNSAHDRAPDWSPDGRKIAFASSRDSCPCITDNVYVMGVDGSGQAPLTTNSQGGGYAPDWSPDGQRIAFTRYYVDTDRGEFEQVWVMRADGTAQTNVAGLYDGGPSSWSPDGTRIAFASKGGSGASPFDYEIWTMNTDGTARTQLTDNSARDYDPDWQPINPAPYPRPVGASPMRLSLVPAFTPCDPASANASHQAPLSGRSCAPPVPRSSLVAVGSNSTGFVRFVVLGSGECSPFDSTRCHPDVTIRVSITDVHSGTSSGPDYDPPGTTDLTAVATLPGAAQGKAIRITDQNNQSVGDPSGPYDKSATVVPISFPIPIGCVVTDTIFGTICNVQTTANTLVPGSAVAGKRALWETGQFQILDQGANGTPGDSDDKVFEVQGLFVP